MRNSCDDFVFVFSPSFVICTLLTMPKSSSSIDEVHLWVEASNSIGSMRKMVFRETCSWLYHVLGVVPHLICVYILPVVFFLASFFFWSFNPASCLPVLCPFCSASNFRLAQISSLLALCFHGCHSPVHALRSAFPFRSVLF